MNHARLIALSLPAHLAACGTKDADNAADTDPVTFDDAELASTLWDDLQGYDAWGQLDGWTGTPVLSGSHMGAYVVAYYNATAVAWDLQGEAPAGTIAVKAQYMAAEDASPMDLVAMRKVPGYDPEQGDWFYAQYGIDGAVAASGRIDMCILCHANVADQSDYVYGAPPTP